MRVRQTALFFLGLYLGFTATIAHRHTSPIGGVDVPWGLLLAVIATFSVAVVVDRWVRLGAAFFGLGWAVALTVPMFARGGSYLIAQDWLGFSFMLGGMGVLALAVLRGSKPPRL